MPLFKYTVSGKDGRIITSSLLAANVSAAVEHLTSLNFKILQIRKVWFDPAGALRSFTKVNRQSLLMFTNRLSVMIKSGLALARSLKILAEQESDLKLRMVLEQVALAVNQGASFSSALSRHPEIFSGLFISMIRIGESTGALDASLTKLEEYLERDYRVRRQTSAALTYPAFVLGFCILTVWVVFVYVLPKIMNIFISSNMSLPLSTRFLLFLVEVCRNPFIQLGVLGAMIYGWFYFKNYLKNPDNKLAFDRMLLKLPIFGNLSKKLLIADFCRSMGILLAGGVPLIKGMDILINSIDNSYFRQSVVVPIYEAVKSGASFAKALKATGFFPIMVQNMVTVGEATGDLPNMFKRVSIFFEMDITYALESLLTMIEPVMLGGLGIVVCFILLAVFTPLYQMMNSFAG